MDKEKTVITVHDSELSEFSIYWLYDLLYKLLALDLMYDEKDRGSEEFNETYDKLLELANALSKEIDGDE